MTATRPEPAPVIGRFARLEPLRRDHLPALFAAIGRREVFASGYNGAPIDQGDEPSEHSGEHGGWPRTEAEFIALAESSYPWGVGNPYGVFLVGGPHDGELVGTSTLADFALRDRAAHIGWTAYDPRVWGSAVNPQTKLLLLDLAFQHGFERVKIQTDAMNARSRAAIAGIGATFEGILRHDRLRSDGSWRDTVVFSVIREEWPSVRAGLEARLDLRGDRPVLFRARFDS